MTIEQTIRQSGRAWVGGVMVSAFALAAVVGALALQGPPPALPATGPLTIPTAISTAIQSPPVRDAAKPAPLAPTARVAPPSARTGLPSPAPIATGGSSGRPKLLWPFTTEAAVLQWQAAFHEDGHQPWHVSACDTGGLFAQFVLGFSTVTVDSCEVRDDQARVRVHPSGQPPANLTVTTISLIRIGANPGGWVVVGSEHGSR